MSNLKINNTLKKKDSTVEPKKDDSTILNESKDILVNKPFENTTQNGCTFQLTMKNDKEILVKENFGQQLQSSCEINSKCIIQ
jgi:hypothetical protein